MMLLEIVLRIGTIVVACVLGWILQNATKNWVTGYGLASPRLTFGAFGFVFPFILAEWVFNIY